MKKKFCITIILSAGLLYFLLPSEIQFKLIDHIVSKDKNPIVNVIQNKIINPVGALCIFQKSEPYSWQGKAAPRSSCFINKDTLDRKVAQGIPMWAKQQIQEDLLGFNNINAIDLERTFSDNNTSSNALVRFKIKDGKVTMTSGTPRREIFNKEKTQEENATNYFRFQLNAYFLEISKTPDPRSTSILYILEYLAKNGYIADTDFILGLNDSVTISEATAPIFSFAKDLSIPAEKDLVLIPDWQNICSTPNMRKRIRAAKKQYGWNDKIERVFWRGGLNDSSGFRERIVDFSKRNPEVIDAKFVSGRPQDKATKFVLPEEHLEYKYLISIDGERASWERLVWHLQSNSLIFKQQSNQIQWYYKGIKPYVHYIPVTDEESVLKNVAWAKSHQNEAQVVINNASTFVDQNLEMEDIYHYIIVLLEEYNKRTIIH